MLFFGSLRTNEEFLDINSVKNIETLAVIEIVLKQRIWLKDEKELMMQEFIDLGMNENYQNLIETYSKFIRTALLFVQNKKITNK